jgi:hypothetical protein
MTTKTLADEIRRLFAEKREAASGSAIRGRHQRKRSVHSPVRPSGSAGETTMKRTLILKPIFPQSPAIGIEGAANESMQIAFEALKRMYCLRRHA